MKIAVKFNFKHPVFNAILFCLFFLIYQVYLKLSKKNSQFIKKAILTLDLFKFNLYASMNSSLEK